MEVIKIKVTVFIFIMNIVQSERLLIWSNIQTIQTLNLSFFHITVNNMVIKRQHQKEYHITFGYMFPMGNAYNSN
jgi:hypothetical protein